MCDPMAYPIFFPSGAPGYSTDMRQVRPLEPIAEIPNEQEEEDSMHATAQPEGLYIGDERQLGFGLEDDNGNNIKISKLTPFRYIKTYIIFY